jgi:hypothetical protein
MEKHLKALAKNDAYMASYRKFEEECKAKQVQIENDALIALHYQVNQCDIMKVLNGEENIYFLCSDQVKMDYIISKVLHDNQLCIFYVTSGAQTPLPKDDDEAELKIQKKKPKSKGILGKVSRHVDFSSR